MAKTTWGRKETIVWPQNRPIYTYGAVFAAILLTALFLYVRLRFLSTPLQWFYTPIYARTSIFGPFSRTHRSQSQLLFLIGDRPRHCELKTEECQQSAMFLMIFPCDGGTLFNSYLCREIKERHLDGTSMLPVRKFNQKEAGEGSRH